jgi:hypothetical protein
MEVGDLKAKESGSITHLCFSFLLFFFFLFFFLQQCHTFSVKESEKLSTVIGRLEIAGENLA